MRIYIVELEAILFLCCRCYMFVGAWEALRPLRSTKRLNESKYYHWSRSRVVWELMWRLFSLLKTPIRNVSQSRSTQLLPSKISTIIVFRCIILESVCCWCVPGCVAYYSLYIFSCFVTLSLPNGYTYIRESDDSSMDIRYYFLVARCIKKAYGWRQFGCQHPTSNKTDRQTNF